MSNEGYNGWKNYETWCVNLWLGNDQGLYEMTLERTEEALAEPRLIIGTDGRYNVAEALKALVCDDLAPDLGATFAADLLGSALSAVDWYEIAEAWMETLADQVPA